MRKGVLFFRRSFVELQKIFLAALGAQKKSASEYLTSGLSFPPIERQTEKSLGVR